MSTPFIYTHVVAAIIYQDSKVLICKRNLDKKNADKWEFPGGKIEFDESEEQALAREIQEELNIEIKIGAKFCSNQFEYKGTVCYLHSYICEFLGGEIMLVDHSECKWVSVSELSEYDFTPADLELVLKLLHLCL